MCGRLENETSPVAELDNVDERASEGAYKYRAKSMAQAQRDDEVILFFYW